MAISIKTVQATANTSTGTQDITISGFGTVKAYMVFGSLATANDAAVAHVSHSYGICDGTVQYTAWNAEEDNAATTITRRSSNSNFVIRHRGLADGEAIHDSFITDGVRIDWTGAPSTAYKLHFVFFGGSDLTVAVSVQSHIAGQDVNVSFTGPGFEPDVVFIHTNGSTLNEVGLGTQSQYGFGIMVNGDLPAMSADGLLEDIGKSRNNFNSENCARRLSNNAVASTFNSNNNNIARFLELVSFDTNGYTLVQRNQSSATTFATLSLNFNGVADAFISDFAGPTGTGDFANTEPGFTPDFLLLFPGQGAAANTNYTTNAGGSGQWNVVLADGTRTHTLGLSHDDGNTVTDTQSYVNTGIETKNETGSASDYVGTVSSFDANGWTLNFTTVDDTTTRWGQLVIGSITGGTNHAAATELTGAATLDGAATVHHEAATELAGAAALDAAATVHHEAAVELAGAAALDADPVVIGTAHAGAAELAGAASLDAAATVHHEAATELSGAATLDAAATVHHEAAAELAGAATLDADPTVDVASAHPSQMNVAVTDVEANTGTGNQTITITDFGDVKAYIIWATNAVADGTEVPHVVGSYGMTDGTSQFCYTGSAQDNVSPSDTWREMDTDQIIRLHDGTTGATDGLATHSSFTTDGIVINWSNAPTAAVRLHVQFFGGDGAEFKADSGQHNAGENNSQSFTGVGFRPDAVIFGGSRSDFDIGNGETAYFGWGAASENADGTISQGCMTAFDNEGETTGQPATRVDNNRVVMVFSTAPDPLAENRSIEFEAMEADGFSLIQRTSGGSVNFFYLAIKSTTNRIFAGVITSPAAGTGDKKITGIGFKPQAVTIAAQLGTTVNTMVVDNSDAGCHGLALFDDTRESSYGIRLNDNANPTDIGVTWKSQALWVEDSAGIDQYDATFVSMDNDGFTLNFTTNAQPTAQWLVIAFEENNSGGMTSAVTDVAAATANGDQDITIAGFGNVKAYIIWATQSLVDGTEVANVSSSYGICDGDNQFCTANSSKDNVSPAETWLQSDSDQVIRLHDGTTSATIALAAHVGMIDDGIRINWSDAPPTGIRLHIQFFGGRDFEAFAGNDQHTAGQNTSQSTTGVGFRADMVLFFGDTNDFDQAAVSGANHQWGGAYDDGSSGDGFRQGLLTVFDDSGQTSGNPVSAVYDDRVHQAWTSVNPPGPFRWLEFDGFEADGFSTIVRNSASSLTFFFLALKSPTNKMFCGAVESASAGTGNKSTTGIGFRPQAVSIGAQLGVTVNTPLTAGVGAGDFALGLFDATSESSFTTNFEADVNPTNVNQEWNSQALYLKNGGAGVELDASFVSMDSDGFTLNYTTNATPGAQWFVVAIEANGVAGMVSAVTDILSPASVGDLDITIPEFGDVKAYRIWWTRGAVDGVERDHVSVSVGMSDGRRSGQNSTSSEDGIGTSDSRHQSDTDQILRLLDGTTGATVGLATHVRFVDDGIRINFSAKPATRSTIHVQFFGGRDFAAYMGNGVHDGAEDSDQTFDAGFSPDMVFLNAHSGAPDIAVANTGVMAQGAGYFDDDNGISQGVVAMFSEFGVVTTHTKLVAWNTRIGTYWDIDGGDIRYLVLKPKVALGFVLEKKLSAVDSHFRYLAIKSRFNKVFAGVIAHPSGSGIQATTGVGFKPQAVAIILQLSNAINTIGTNGGAGGSQAVGLFDGTRETAYNHRDHGGVSTTETGTTWKTTAIYLESATGFTVSDAVFESFDADGFSLDYATNVIGGRQWLIVAIEEQPPTAPGGTDHAAAAELTGAATLDAAGTVHHEAAVELAGAATLDAVAGIQLVGAAEMAGAAAVDAAATVHHQVAIELAGAASLDADPVLFKVAAIELAGAASLDAAATVHHEAAAELAGAATLDADPEVAGSIAAAAELAGAAALDAAATVHHEAASELAGAASLDADPALFREAAIEIAGDAALDAAATVHHEAATELAGAATLDADPTLAREAKTELAGAAALDAAATVHHEAKTELAGAAALDAAATVHHEAEAELAGAAVLDADPTVLGTLVAEAELAGDAVLDAAATVHHEAAIELAGAATLDADPTLTRDAQAELAGAAALDAAATVHHEAAIELAGAATLDADPKLFKVGAIELTGAASLDAAATIHHEAAAEMAGAATLDASARLDIKVFAELAGAAALDANPIVLGTLLITKLSARARISPSISARANVSPTISARADISPRITARSRI